ncbi:macro domain-containing protein [Actinophytocola sp.]|uniref:macro domain-containing protein n=1 Tax=Actinophytocola sp. TaxID=1872138 RepID=UPI002ED15090
MAAIEVVLGDITRQDVDAVVTAANESLLGGGGVDGAIHRAAGPRLAAAGAEVGPCAPGEAVATPAFDLAPVRYVIHTVGPVWEDGDHDEARVLASCYQRALLLAEELGVRSVAFPAIATGTYGFPAELAAEVAATAVRSIPVELDLIRLVAFDERTRDLLTAALARSSTERPGS